jgi:hypothetical protein
MQKNPHLAKSIADVAWNQFIRVTKSKAEEAGSPGDSGESQEYVSNVLQMWHDRRKDTL